MAALLSATLLPSACSRDPQPNADTSAIATEVREGIVTVSGDDRISDTLTWRVPAVVIAEDGVASARKRAAAALAADDLYASADTAVPLYLALSARLPADAAVTAGLRGALARVIVQGDAALKLSDDDIGALRDARQLAAVARAVDENAATVQAYLQRVDRADQLWELNRQGDLALLSGDLGEQRGGALAHFRAALALRPKQPRALQGVAAVESAMIRRAEDVSARSDFVAAKRWLAFA
ncbi:MAG: formylglycine-generating enzyme family protein, partial [Luteimonas sp.]